MCCIERGFIASGQQYREVIIIRTMFPDRRRFTSATFPWLSDIMEILVVSTLKRNMNLCSLPEGRTVAAVVAAVAAVAGQLELRKRGCGGKKLRHREYKNSSLKNKRLSNFQVNQVLWAQLFSRCSVLVGRPRHLEFSYHLPTWLLAKFCRFFFFSFCRKNNSVTPSHMLWLITRVYIT